MKSMIKLGMVDGVTLFPLTLGADGREPIFVGWPRARLELADVRVLDARLVMLEYRPGR